MSNPNHTKFGSKSNVGVQTAVDLRPVEDSFDRDRRLAKELEAFVDKAEADRRASRERKSTYAEQRPRIQALAQMAKGTIGHRANETIRAKLRELHADPTFRSLPPAERAAWDALAKEHDETAQGGDYRAYWAAIDQLASEQAVGLVDAEWDPAEATREENDPSTLAAMIPRNSGLVPPKREG